MSDIAAFIEARLVEHEAAFAPDAPDVVLNWTGSMRGILEQVRQIKHLWNDASWWYGIRADEILSHMAGIWKTHDDYREEWKVGP